MDVITTALPGVLLVRPRVFRDSRGAFLESWHRDRYVRAGIPATFVQDNAAFSRRGVIRGLHYQYPEPQGKLVMVLHGTVLDVVVDIRQGSPAFGKWLGAELSSENGHQLWIPEGLAHGYAVLSDSAVVAYKCTRSYNPAGDAAIRYNDPALGIDWGVVDPVLSDRDSAAPLLSDVPLDRLPRL
jgi:dTDP-4-dehydrorhamnose 3,5-epimerase